MIAAEDTGRHWSTILLAFRLALLAAMLGSAVGIWQQVLSRDYSLGYFTVAAVLTLLTARRLIQEAVGVVHREWRQLEANR